MKGSIQGNIIRLQLIKVSKWFMLTMPILMIYFKELGLSSEEAFRLKAIYSITIVLFEIPSGYLADLLGRRKTLIMGAFLGTLGFAFYSISEAFAMLVIAEITLGIGQSMISGSDSALLYDSLKELKQEKNYTKQEGKVTAIGNIAEAVSAILGGLLAYQSIRTPFFFQTAIAFIAIPSALTIIEPLTSKTHKSNSIIKQFIKQVKANPLLLKNIMYSSVTGTATLTMAWLYQLFIKEDLKFDLITIGAIAAVLNFVIGIISAHAYKFEQKFGFKKSLAALSIAIPIGFLLMGFINSVYALIPLFAFYLFRGYATPVLKDYINQETESSIRATVLSVRTFVIRMIFAVIGPFTGSIVDKFSYSYAFIFLGLFFGAFMLSSYLITFHLPKKH